MYFSHHAEPATSMIKAVKDGLISIAMRAMLRIVCTALVFVAGTGHAQMSLLPPACASLTGPALDKCVRDITVEQMVPRLEAVEPPPADPSKTQNCNQVLRADQTFCIGRNEIILHCKSAARNADFMGCFTKYIPNVAKPALANCALEPSDRRGECAARNRHYGACLDEPLSYFLCVGNQGRLPERMLKP